MQPRDVGHEPQGEPGLTDAAGAGDGQEAKIGAAQERLGQGKLALAADQRGHRGGQADHIRGKGIRRDATIVGQDLALTHRRFIHDAIPAITATMPSS